MLEVTTKTNGYEISKELEEMKNTFIEEVNNRFYDYNGEIELFYYGERLIMCTVRFNNKSYGQFNITANRVSFNGHTCSLMEYNIFASLTHNDECYPGTLIRK